MDELQVYMIPDICDIIEAYVRGDKKYRLVIKQIKDSEEIIEFSREKWNLKYDNEAFYFISNRPVLSILQPFTRTEVFLHMIKNKLFKSDIVN